MARITIKISWEFEGETGFITRSFNCQGRYRQSDDQQVVGEIRKYQACHIADIKSEIASQFLRQLTPEKAAEYRMRFIKNPFYTRRMTWQVDEKIQIDNGSS